MKSIQEPKTLVRSGVKKSTECGMVVNAKAFEMLARQYSDPIKAILQEISANAADSHIRAGIPERPFDVKLPNALDPHFRVRDYGVSMTQETIYGVYINYMKSDKTHTNDETGFFGIGSKTPLAYTDSFNIKTYLDGKMNLYTLGYNEHGIPELNEFAEYDTDEENGVEISFSVKQDDFSRFAEKAAHVYSFFDVPPNVGGVTSFETKTFAKMLEGSNWFMFADSNFDTSYVVMGNIAYPINTDDIDASYSSDYYQLVSGGIVLEVPMGTVSMTPSREALEYNEKTIGYIKSQLDVVLTEIQESVEKELDACPNKWTARLKATKMANSLEWRFSRLLNLNKWRGEQVPKNFKMGYDCPKTKEDIGSVERKYYLDNGRVRCRTKNLDQSIPINARSVIVIKDSKSKFDSRCRFLCSTNSDKVFYLIEIDVSEQKLREDLDCGDADIIFHTSNLPDPPKNPNNRSYNGVRRKTTTSVMNFHPNRDGKSGRNYESEYWSEGEIDLKADPSTTYIYMEWFNYEYSSDGQSYNIREVFRLLNKIKIGLPKNFYGIKTAQLNKVSKCANWIPFHEWVHSQIAERYDNEEFRQQVAFNKSLDNIDLEDEICELVKHKKVDFVSEDSDFVKFINFVVDYGDTRRKNMGKEELEDFSRVRELTKLCRYDLKLDNVVEGNKGKELFTKVEQKYPLVIAVLKRYYYTNIQDHADAIVCTVNAIDSYLN